MCIFECYRFIMECYFNVILFNVSLWGDGNVKLCIGFIYNYL